MQYTIQSYIHYKYTTIYYYAVHGTHALTLWWMKQTWFVLCSICKLLQSDNLFKQLLSQESHNESIQLRTSRFTSLITSWELLNERAMRVEGVWVQSRTIGRASHSLISHTKGARNAREMEGQQRLTSRLLTASPHIRYLSTAVYRHWSATLVAPNSLSLIEFAAVLSHLVCINPLYTQTVRCGGWGNSMTIWHVFTSVVPASIYEEKSWHSQSH